MASYKDRNREIKGYVELNYDVVDVDSSDGITTTLSISRNSGYSFNYNISENDYTQTLEEIYSTDKLLSNYAVLCDNFTSLDGSFFLFNKKTNESGFYSEYIIDEYVNKIEDAGYEARDFVLQIGSKSNLISGEAVGITLYTQNNNFVLSDYGNQVVAELYDCDGELIETSNNCIFYSEQFSIIFENSINDCYIMVKQFGFEYSDRPAIITHIDLGISHLYKDKSLIDFTVTEEVNKLGTQTPNNELVVTIGDYEQLYDPLNPTGITKYLTEDSKIIPYIGLVQEDGQTEYTKMGEFFFDSIDYKDKEVTITAYNLMKQLSNVMIKNTNASLTSQSMFILVNRLKDRIETFLSNCYDYEYDISLSNLVGFTIARLKYCTLAAFLQKLVLLEGIFYVDRDNKIILRAVDTSIVESLSGYELLEKINYSNVKNYKSYYINSYIGSKQSSISGTVSTSFVLQKEEEEICITSDDGGLMSISSSDITVSGGSAELLPASDGTNNCHYMAFFKVTGNIGDEVTIEITVSKNFSPTGAKVLYGSDENTNIEIDDPFIFGSNATKCDAFINKMYSYEVSASYNGNPNIKAGDYIEVESDYGYVPVFVTKHSLTYDGGLSGSIEGVE